MSNILNIAQLQAGLTVNGKTYKFVGLNSVNVSDPRVNHITRGADGIDSEGITYSSGNSQPIVITANIRTTQNFYKLFKDLYDNKTRFDFFLVDTIDGRITTYKSAIMQSEPYQRTISENEDSIGVDFVIESMTKVFDFKDNGDFE